MNWHNLDKNKCPKCGKDLIIGLEEIHGGFIYCSCGFKIRPERMKEIVTKPLRDQFPNEGHYRPEDENPE